MRGDALAGKPHLKQDRSSPRRARGNWPSSFELHRTEDAGDGVPREMMTTA